MNNENLEEQIQEVQVERKEGKISFRELLKKAKTKASELTDKFVDSELGQEINADKLVGKVKAASTKTATKIREVAGTAKKYAYEGAGALERQYHQKQSIGGSARKAIKKGRILGKAVKLASKPLGADKVTAKTKEYYQRLHDYNQSFIETFTTEGKYDESKLKELLLHEVAVADVYGQKALRCLKDLAKKSKSAIHEDYRKWIPTLEELTDKYAGIGIKCDGLILKPDLEACLNFHNEAYQKLPKEELTLSIMQDIKTHAITNKDELLRFYMPEGDPGENQNKVSVILKYL